MIVFLPLATWFTISLFGTNKTQELSVSEQPLKFFFLGLFLACFYAFFEVLFIQSLTYRQTRNSIILNTLLLFCFDYFLPSAILFLLVFFGSKKSYEQRMTNLFSFMAGFYSVYMVYSSLLRYEKTSAFFIFVKPILIFCFIFMFSQGMVAFFNLLKKEKESEKFVSKISLAVLFLVISSIVPPLIQAMYVTGKSLTIRIILTILYVFLFSVFFCIRYKSFSTSSTSFSEDLI